MVDRPLLSRRQTFDAIALDRLSCEELGRIYARGIVTAESHSLSQGEHEPNNDSRHGAAGRYGPYVTDGKKNARIPKDGEPKHLTLEECQAMIEAAPERRGRRGAKKKPTKKAAAKKTAAKKKTTKKKKKTTKKRAKKKAAKTQHASAEPAVVADAAADDGKPAESLD